MRLRKATPGEFPTIRAFYWRLIDRLSGTPSTIGWKKGIYPSDAFLKESLAAGELYVMDGPKGIWASVVANSRWNEGYEGQPWILNCTCDEVLVPHALGVAAEYQGQGIGKAVVRELIRMARQTGKRTIRLDILGGNIAAEKLYTSMGFQQIAEARMFYEDTGWTEFILYELPLEEKDRV